MENVAAQVLFSNNFSHTNLVILFHFHTVIKSNSLMMGASNLAILIFWTGFFHFWHLLSYSP